MIHLKDFPTAEKAFLKSGMVSEEDFSRAEKLAEQENISLTAAIVRLEILSEEEVVRVLADALGFPFIELSRLNIAPEILSEIPEVVARKNRIVAFKKDSNGLHLAMANPTELEIRDFIERKEGLPVIAYAAADQDIDAALEFYGKRLTDILKETLEDVSKDEISAETKDGQEIEFPIIQVVEKIIIQAYHNRASDIHIEPRENADSVVRFRIDGVLHDVAKIPEKLHPQVISRTKIMSKLRTDEHQAPQDGKISFPLEEDKLDIDIRVSIVPVLEGEKAVLRLLAERSRQFSLTNLGLNENNLKKIREAYMKPYGMILSTGPTGCGKTTTLYAVLKLLNKRQVNIMTIEDPVEYDLEGVSQIQVNPKAKLTFATGLRSILRQDPNIILVGEIRDRETAGIAVNLGLTGHLVLSTLHTNDSATAIPRFVDLGIEPFLVASTVNVIIAQRLVRKIHEKCRMSEDVKMEDVAAKIGRDMAEKMFGSARSEAREILHLYRGKGCDGCQGTGYQGRIGIFEVMTINDEIRQAILQNKDAGFLQELSKKAGMITMLEDGMEKVNMGITTIDEVLGATKL